MSLIKEAPCRFLGECIGYARGTVDVPLYSCDAKGDPTLQGKTKLEELKYCRVSSPQQQAECTEYEV